MPDWTYFKSGSSYAEITPKMPNPSGVPITTGLESNRIKRKLADGSYGRVTPLVKANPKQVRLGYYHQSHYTNFLVYFLVLKYH